MTTIVLAADERYLPYIPSNLAQIARFGRSATGVTLVIPEDLPQDHLAIVNGVADMHEIALGIAPVKKFDFRYAGTLTRNPQRFSQFAFNKLLLAELLPDLDHVLYLDVDTLIRAPLDDLLSRQLAHSLGAVPELDPGGRHLFGTNREPYFNAGVLRMSLERMRQQKIWDQAEEILRTHGGLILGIQDVLNVMFRQEFDLLPPTFNVLDSQIARYGTLSIIKDPIIVHFCGQDKPWSPKYRSQYAQEWRRHSQQASFPHSQRVSAYELPTGESGGDEKTRQGSDALTGRLGPSRIGSVARTVLPGSVKNTARSAAMKFLAAAESRIEFAQQRLRPSNVFSASPALPDNCTFPEERSASAHHLDLLISVPRSGTKALGEAIQRARPDDVHWLGELYLGRRKWPIGEGDLDRMLIQQFPWFRRDADSDGKRTSGTQDFAVAINRHVVEVTNAVLNYRPGRTLIKVFPDHLGLQAFERLLRSFRPRLLILRRDLVFSYISHLRAQRTESWAETESSYVPYTISERAALEYTVQSDVWFDRVAVLAERLALDTVWLTYTGLFATGSEISLLESFYPGPPMDVDESGRLRSELQIQDRRTDPSILEMIKAISNLSATTQNRLLRLPGGHA